MSSLSRILSDLNENPEKYEAIRRRVAAAGSDAERAEILIEFATSFEELKGMALEKDDEIALGVTITTVGITTTISAS